MSVEQSLLEDVTSGLVRHNDNVPGVYAPRLIANHPGDTMGQALGDELAGSDFFDMSVAFVSAEAIRTLFEDFKTHAAHAAHVGAGTPNSGGDADTAGHVGAGRLITSTKSYFNTPKAFWDLLRLKEQANVDVRVWKAPQDRSGRDGQPFHPKGYVFARSMDDGSKYYNLYVGSSNLTQHALGVQREWNLKISSLHSGELVEQFQREIDLQVEDSEPLTREWIARYEEEFAKYAPSRSEALREVERRSQEPVVPNGMQREALRNLEALRRRGERRAMIVSATGTGKTYLSAFDVRRCRPRRMLYVAQRQEILVAAMRSYQRVLGCADTDLGLFSGTSKDHDRKYVFATVQTLSRPEVLERFATDEFEYVLVDEVHHAGAQTYRRVIDHFDGASFMLGMTATPERTDGVNIFSLFDHNVAYEIRLQQALDEHMLCPFHYYGVAEYLGSAEAAQDAGRDGAAAGVGAIAVSSAMSAADSGQLHYEIEQLATAERVRYIVDVLQQYSPYHQQVTGLVFCSTVDEARRLSALFNGIVNQREETRCYRTRAVTGQCSPQERQEAIAALERGDLDYIFTVDVFNEGVDIPAVNQIVMLRNTQSSIVFTQQLGRGLRMFPGKDSVIVIDFIGNYANNYLIPVALYGNTGERDVARKNLQRRSIGLSSISFDAIAKERVLASLDQADWSEMKRLTEEYRQLRFQLGRVPMLTDVYAHDPSLPLTLAAKQGSYLQFVVSRERRADKHTGKPVDKRGDRRGVDVLCDVDALTATHYGLLKMATEVLLPGLRPHELVVLAELLGCYADTGVVAGVVPEAGVEAHPNAAADVRANAAAGGGLVRDWVDVAKLSDTIAHDFPDAYHNAGQMASALRVLDMSYYTDTTRRRFGGVSLVEASADGRMVRLGGEFADLMERCRTFAWFMFDTLRCGLAKCRETLAAAHELRRDGRNGDRAFVYEYKYTLADVERLLGWLQEINAQNVGGYRCDRDTGTMPIFVKYATSQYEDRFMGPQDMRYFSKNKRTPSSPEFVWMARDYGTEAWTEGHFIPLFVMRKEESKEAKYYYVGHVDGYSEPKLVTKRSVEGGAQVKVTVTNLHLSRPIDGELYRHITGEVAN